MQILKLWLPYVQGKSITPPPARQDRSGCSQKVHPKAEKVHIKVLKSTRVFKNQPNKKEPNKQQLFSHACME